jgi:lysophospholipid acyltransferase (LPLAT)-like uncharacterized protein
MENKNWWQAFKEKVLLSLISFLGPRIILMLGKSLKIKWEGEENLKLAQGKSVVYAFWHGRMLILAYSHRKRNVHFLSSQHRDGEISSRIWKRLGFISVRGSTTKGGAQAILEIISKMKSGYDFAITPDGPKGPKFAAKPGVVYIAQKTGRPIIPITYSAKAKWVLKSWDSFIIPKPFSPAVIILGNPIFVPSALLENELEEKRIEVEKSLTEITKQADNYF